MADWLWLTGVASEHGLVQSRDADGLMSGLVLYPGHVHYPADDLDESLAGGHVQRRLAVFVEIVGALGVRDQQLQRHVGVLVPHRLVQRGVARAVGHGQGALGWRLLRGAAVGVLAPGLGEAQQQLRHLGLVLLGRQVQRGVAVVVPSDEQLLVPVQDLAGERGVAVQGGEVERRVELGRRGAEGTGILRIHQLPQARLATFPSVAAMYSAGSMRLSLSIDWQPQIEQIIFLAAGSAFNLIRLAQVLKVRTRRQERQKEKVVQLLTLKVAKSTDDELGLGQQLTYVLDVYMLSTLNFSLFCN